MILEELVDPIFESEYTEFCRWADSVSDVRIDEGLIPGNLKRKFQFIKDIASQLKVNLKDLIGFFKNRSIFKLFSKIGWSLKKLYSYLKMGFKAYQQVLGAVSEYIAKSGVGKWTEDKLKDLDSFLQNHPKLKRIAGIAVASMLVYIWFNMTFTGDAAYDFGMDDMIAALGGKFALSSLFAGADGTKLLMLFATGALGLSFPWPGPAKIQFAVGIFQTLAQKVKVKLRPDPTPLST